MVRVGLGAAHDVCKGQLPVLLDGGEAEVFGAEVEQGVEEDEGRVRPQLFALPQQRFLHARLDASCRRRREGRREPPGEEVGFA